jgi:predicted RNA-binding Zn-ribbon protein involved in translation (DUF1610 family)
VSWWLFVGVRLARWRTLTLRGRERQAHPERSCGADRNVVAAGSILGVEPRFGPHLRAPGVAPSGPLQGRVEHRCPACGNLVVADKRELERLGLLHLRAFVCVRCGRTGEAKFVDCIVRGLIVLVVIAGLFSCKPPPEKVIVAPGVCAYPQEPEDDRP